jgi:hypothetical protein
MTSAAISARTRGEKGELHHYPSHVAGVAGE